MRHCILFVLSFFVISLTSCRTEFDFEPSTGGLEFSRDTVYLDTVFTNIGSSTYTLKVYNRSDKDIAIPSIKLARPDSKYRLMVDGVPGTNFTNVELLAKDSMFVFIETTAGIADANPDDFLYIDEILFSSVNGVQSVDLVTLIQDAVFIYPDRPLSTGIKETLTISGVPTSDEGHELNTPEELHWTDDKPYVIYGFALVPNTKTLVIDKGARVHFHADSGLIIDKDGAVQVNGEVSQTDELENEVIFEGDRLEPGFADVPGQWAFVLSFSERNDNLLNHITIKNAAAGLLLQKMDPQAEGTPKMTINNTQVYNCSLFGIRAQKAEINSENLVANYCGIASVALTQGGTYTFKHATIANYYNAFNQVPLLINDYADIEDTRYLSALSATFDNCIIYGSNSIGMSLENYAFDEGLADASLTFSVAFNNCLIKLFDTSNQLEDNDLYPFDDNDAARAAYNTVTRELLAESANDPKPDYVDPQDNDLHLGEDSVEIQNAGFDAGVTTDADGNPRDGSPALGAYEFVPGE